eukprot:8830_1
MYALATMILPNIYILDTYVIVRIIKCMTVWVVRLKAVRTSVKSGDLQYDPSFEPYERSIITLLQNKILEDERHVIRVACTILSNAINHTKQASLCNLNECVHWVCKDVSGRIGRIERHKCLNNVDILKYSAIALTLSWFCVKVP